ncbi:MAG: DUF853 family protein, partial [Caldisphaera sp.]|nr:DUF853 family protein [Caldisphaera sp.]
MDNEGNLNQPNLGLNFEQLKNSEDEVEKLKLLLNKAYQEAEKRGKIVGWVSRFGEVRVEENSKVEFYVDPNTYYASEDAPFHRVGDYLVIIDPKDTRMVLIRVKGIVRKDELAAVGIEPPISPILNSIEPRGLITGTLVEGELVLEMNNNDKKPRPATKSIEPQSPVIDPMPNVLTKLLDLPNDGIIMGSLSTPSGLIKEGKIPVRLPVSALFHHLLILGTTGSGKTTLIKNIIVSLYNLEKHPAAVIFDLNQDFIQLPIKNSINPTPIEVYNNCYKNLEKINGLVIVLPISIDMLRDKLSNKSYVREDDIINAIKGIIDEYFKESFEPLIGSTKSNITYKFENNTMIFELMNQLNIIVIPYFINTMLTNTDNLTPLMPGLTSLGRDLIKKMREKFKKQHNYYPPMHALYGALAFFTEKALLKQNRYDKDYNYNRNEIEDSDLLQLSDYIMPYIIANNSTEAGIKALLSTYKINGKDFTLYDAISEYIEILEKAKFHRETIQALYRRISSLMETEVIDILVSKGNSLYSLSEPDWSTIVNIASERNVPVVLDLKWGMEEAGFDALRVIAYRTLDRLISWKHNAWAQRIESPHLIVVIDEAHQFFQNESKVKEELEAIRQVSSMISKIARLGRARGVGLIFSTHAPNDLNDIITQLTNTKI